MLKVRFGDSRKLLRRVLCLGAHCDDIEIGCGGTILRLIQENRGLQFYWVVLSSTPARKREARQAARLFLESTKLSEVVIENFRDSFFPYEGRSIKVFVESLRKRFQPDLIFTHSRNDLHQDHRLISELTWNAFRDHLILEYEIPKYDGDLGTPNLFVGFDEAICKAKIHHILASFRSQSVKQWFGEDTFRALMRLRAIESNSTGRYAEGFYCRKVLV